MKVIVESGNEIIKIIKDNYLKSIYTVKVGETVFKCSDSNFLEDTKITLENGLYYLETYSNNILQNKNLIGNLNKLNELIYAINENDELLIKKLYNKVDSYKKLLDNINILKDHLRDNVVNSDKLLNILLVIDRDDFFEKLKDL